MINDFGAWNFTKPANADLLWILNEKELALDRLNKSYQ